MSEDPPTRQLVEQRVRNGVIWYLQIAASFDEQRRYQREAPIAHVTNEMIEQWRDWVQRDPRTRAQPGVYSDDEVAAMRAYEAVRDDVIRRTPDRLPAIEETQTLPEWEALRQAAAAALAVFEVRGVFPQDVEI